MSQDCPGGCELALGGHRRHDAASVDLAGQDHYVLELADPPGLPTKIPYTVNTARRPACPKPMKSVIRPVESPGATRLVALLLKIADDLLGDQPEPGVGVL
jgi:hypothetical protein